MSDKLYIVGKIVNTHGIRGELKILSLTDFPEERFAVGSKLIIQDEKQQSQIPVVIQSSRLHKNVYIVKFAQFHNINEVEKLKGSLLKVEEKYRAELEEDEYYYHEILGCKVITDEEEELGTISEILTPGANDVWVVSRPKGRDVLIPVINDVLLSVDIPNKTVRIHLMEGLLD